MSIRSIHIIINITIRNQSPCYHSIPIKKTILPYGSYENLECIRVPSAFAYPKSLPLAKRKRPCCSMASFGIQINNMFSIWMISKPVLHQCAITFEIVHTSFIFYPAVTHHSAILIIEIIATPFSVSSKSTGNAAE